MIGLEAPEHSPWAHKLFENVRIGTPIYAQYESVKLGKRDGIIYLSVSPDVYRTGKLTLESVWGRLAEAGIADDVDEEKVRRIVGRQDGFPGPVTRDDKAVREANPVRTTLVAEPGLGPKHPRD